METPVVITDIQDVRAFLMNTLRDRQKRAKYQRDLPQ